MPDTKSEPQLSVAVASLLKGVVYQDTHQAAWRDLLALQARVRDYVDVLGLVLVVDETEGYAFLRSKPDTDTDDSPVPRLIARRALSFHVSLLLALLRKKLAEFDATSSDPRLILTREQLVEMVRVFLPESNNEVRVLDKIDGYLEKVVDLGFLRKVKGSPGTFEVRRIVKAFVDAQWLSEFDRRLGEYAAALEREDD